MAEKFKQETSAEKIDSFLTRNRKIILTVFLVALVAVIAVVVCAGITSKVTKDAIAKYDTIYYTLTYNANGLTGDELTARQDAALSELATLTGKGGIAGARANMLAAELYFQKEDYEAALAAWEKAGALKKKSYLSPFAYYNAAVCAENMHDLDKAIALYQTAADAADFAFAEHAQFNVGRVNEAKQDYAAAVAAYTKLNDDNAGSELANLAKTRLITLKTEGKVQ